MSKQKKGSLSAPPLGLELFDAPFPFNVYPIVTTPSERVHWDSKAIVLSESLVKHREQPVADKPCQRVSLLDSHVPQRVMYPRGQRLAGIAGPIGSGLAGDGDGGFDGGVAHGMDKKADV